MDPAASLPHFPIGANLAPLNMPLTSKKFIGAVEDEWQLFRYAVTKDSERLAKSYFPYYKAIVRLITHSGNP